MFYYISLPLISCTQMSTLQPPCSIHMQNCSPLLSTTSTLTPKLCYHSQLQAPSQVRQKTVPWIVHRQVRRFQTSFTLLLPFWGREPGIQLFLPNCTTPFWAGSRSRASTNATKCPTVLNMAFSWLGVCLVAEDHCFPELPENFFNQSAVYLTFSWKNKGPEIPSLPSCWYHSIDQFFKHNVRKRS